MSKKLLWVGDAGVPTGLAKVTHSILDVLKELDWDIHVLGINYYGDPHGYDYKLYPACRPVDNDMFGFSRIQTIIKTVKPDLVCLLHDPWNLYNYIHLIRQCEDPEIKNVPLVAYIPVDAENMRYEWASALNDLHRAIFYTEFGYEVCKASGYGGSGTIIPHGVDLEIFSPVDRVEARTKLGIQDKLPKDAFIIGNVNQNQVRKRLDITVRAFYAWLKKSKVRNAWLYMHAKSQGVVDLNQLATYYERIYKIKPKGRLITLGDNMTAQGGVAEQYMKHVYGSFDVHVNSCGGEGWGLSTLESMAGRIPNIIPGFGALQEWTRGAAHVVPCNNTLTWEFNTIGHMPSEEAMTDAFDKMYTDEDYRIRKGQEGYNLVQRPFFKWEAIAHRFHNVFRAVLQEIEDKAKENNEVHDGVSESSAEDVSVGSPT